MAESPISLWFPAIHGTALIGFILAMLFGLTKKERPARYVFLAGLLCLGLNLTLVIITAMRLPLYGMFESMTTILWVVGGCLYLNRKPQSSFEFMAGCGTMAALAGLTCLFPLHLTPDFFMYSSLWVQFFFFFRLLSAGVILYTGIRFTAAWKAARGTKNQSFGIRQQHVLLIAGTVLFLLSELSGSIWCLNGWGDSWRWSENFFQSAAVFFLIMINIHMPSRLLRSPEKKSAFGALTSFTVVFLFLW